MEKFIKLKTSIKRNVCPALLFAMFLLGTYPTFAQEATFQGLGTLPSYYQYYTEGVSADGSVVVGHAWSSTWTEAEAFRWTESDGIVGLGYLGLGE